MKAGQKRAEELLGLFAYHRDAPLVARALRLSLAELVEELDALKIRRRAFRIAGESAAQMPRAAKVEGASGPTVRRRSKNHAPAPQPKQLAPAREEPDQAGELKKVLAAVGPRRAQLARRLDLTEATLLARFRAAGLEREFALRERDLVRALWSKHRASERKVADELGTSVEGVRRISIDRGLARELDRMRDSFRHELMRERWPRGRIELLLHRREELRELGLLDELEREVSTRTRVLWERLREPEALRRELKISRLDAEKLRRLLDLR